MKQKMRISGLFLLLLFLLSVQNALADDVSIQVKGMVCSFCAQGLKKTFSKKENVESVDVDLDHKIIKLKLKESKTISDAEIEGAITDAGFNVEKIERSPSA